MLLVWTLTTPVTPSAPAATSPPAQPSVPSLKTLVEAATAEGQVRVNWSGGLQEKWRQTFEIAFDHEFGTHLKLNVVTPNETPAAGQRPDWDVELGSEEAAAELARAGRLERQNWTSLIGAPAQAVLFDGGSVAFAQRAVRPAYNAKQVPVSTAPHTWKSLLEARWKGRLGVSSAIDVWTDLSFTWGDARTSEFAAGLAGQQPVRGTPLELERKLEQGGIDVLAAIDDAALHDAKLRDAQVRPVDVQPLLLQSVVVSPLADAAHPNAAVLFAGFLVTQEGQQLWQDFSGESSIYVPGSPSAELVRGKHFALPDQQFFLQVSEARRGKYAKALGY